MKREKKQVLYEGGSLIVGRLTRGTYQELRVRRPGGVWVLLVPAEDLQAGAAALRGLKDTETNERDPRQPELPWE
jgi:hypothetical protein